MDGAFRDRIKRLLRKARSLEREEKERMEAAKARHEAALNMEEPDRIPVGVGIGPVWSDWYFKKRYHVKIGKYWRDPKLLIEYQLRTWIDSFEDFKDDRTYVIPGAVGPLGGVVLHPSIVGCKAVFPEDDFAWIDLRYRIFDTKEKIDDFITPEIPEAGLMPETLGRVEEVRKLVGDLLDVRILGGNGSALQMAAYTRGIKELIRDMYTDPPIVHKLMKKMMDVYEKMDQYYEAEWGIPYCNIEEGRYYDNPLAYFSPPLVERFVLPYYREYAKSCGWEHWSFETQDTMDEFVDLFRTVPIKTLGSLVSSSDLGKFKEVLGPRGVRFNVFLAPGRLVGSSGIEPEVRRIIDIMGHKGGWTLSSGVIDKAIPESNIQAFLKAVNENGRCR